MRIRPRERGDLLLRRNEADEGERQLQEAIGMARHRSQRRNLRLVHRRVRHDDNHDGPARPDGTHRGYVGPGPHDSRSMPRGVMARGASP